MSRDFVVINRYLRQKRHDYLEPLGLKGYHARYLIEISRMPGISQDKLAQKLGVDKSNVARQVVFLEENGFLTRQAAPTDKRVQQLFLTPKAIQLVEPLQKDMAHWEQVLTGVLTQEETRQLTALLTRLRVAIEREEVEA